MKHSHLDFGHGTSDNFFGSSDGLVPALLWDGLDILEQLFKGVKVKEEMDYLNVGDGQGTPLKEMVTSDSAGPRGL